MPLEEAGPERISDPSGDHTGKVPNEVTVVPRLLVPEHGQSAAITLGAEHNTLAVRRPRWLRFRRGRCRDLSGLAAVERSHPNVEVPGTIRRVGNEPTIGRERGVCLQARVESHASKGPIDGRTCHGRRLGTLCRKPPDDSREAKCE